MRQPILTRTFLTLIAVLSLQCAGPVQATLTGETALSPLTDEAALAPTTADKATQTDPVTFEATLPLESAQAPMDYQTTDTATPDIQQEKAPRPTASVTARPIPSGSKGASGGKREKKAPGGSARQSAGGTGSHETPESARSAEAPRVLEPIEEVAQATDDSAEDEEDKISINTASLDDLVDGLKGIGPKKGQAIIDYRNQHGPFEQIGDLEKVKGIGPATMARLKECLKL